MNKMQIYTVGGVVKLVDFREFCKLVPIFQLHNETMAFPTTVKVPIAEIITNKSDVPTGNITYKEHKLEPIKELHGYKPTILNDTGSVLQRILHPRIERDIIQHLMKNKIDFHFNDLGTAEINDLATKYYENFGRDGYGITFRLNKHQKFFAITSEQDFAFAFSPNRNEVLGKFICYDDTKWICCIYTHEKYIREVEEQRVYR